MLNRNLLCFNDTRCNKNHLHEIVRDAARNTSRASHTLGVEARASKRGLQG